ncbi:hypothetical protein ACQRET_03390 [Streptomyces koyangensis]|uniref:hypothetical protein n=1 Tax=Streptomyces koyangensis TaxID=188770 RepID=UPI003CFE538D
MTGSQPGGAVPPAPNQARATAPVVFVPLGYGPAVAARARRLALLNGPTSGPREWARRPDTGRPTNKPV